MSVVAPLPTPASLLPSTLNLITGASGTFTLALNAAQPIDTVVPLSVTNSSVLQAPASITVPAGRTDASFSVSGLAAGSAQLAASLNGTTRTADIVVAAPPAAVAAVEPATFSLQLGATGGATVRLNAVQQQDVNVTLAAAPAGVLQVPLNLVVPAGNLTALAPVTALAQGVAVLTATLPGGAASSTVTVTPPPVLITGISPATLSLAKGRSGTLRLAVSPAPTAPVVVALTASSSVIGVPAQLTIPAGALGADIPVLAASEGGAVVSASLNGSGASASVQVTPPEVQLLELSPLDATAFVGDTLQYNAVATLTDGTTRDDTTRATWVSSNPGVAPINSSGVAQALAPGNTTISATSGGVTRTTPLSVLATPTLGLSPPAASVKVGDVVAYTLTSSAAADAGGLVVTLEGSGSGTITAPATVTIAAGQTSATFSVTATGAGTVTLSARAPRRTAASASIVIGSAVVITSVTPSIGPVGAEVTINGSGFDPVAANDRVVFTGATAAGAVATVRSASPTQLLVSVPTGAQSGPISVTTPLGTAVSPAFTVQGEQDFGIAASPAESVLIAGTSTTVAVQPSSTGTKAFTGLLDIVVPSLPAGITAKLQPATLNTSQTGSIVFTASASAAAGRYEVLVQASGLTSAGRQTKTATVVLAVQSATGATGVKGRFVTPEGRPVAGVLVRVDAIQTATDAAGNFLLTGLPAGAVTLRFDATPAHPLNPIWPYSITLTSGQIAVIADWTINPPPADETFVPIANAAATQKVTDARYPGLEITLPAGVSIVGWDGVPKTRIAVERIALDKLPVSMPPVPIKEAFQLYFGTPMGGIPSQPIPVTLPNVAEAEPGEKSEIWYFDGSPMGGTGEWKLAGLGTISADGKTVVSDPGVGIPRFCGVCGLVSQSCPPPPAPPPPPPRCPRATGGNPVDLFTGQEMPTSSGLTCGGLVPIDTGMTYNPVDAFNGRAGTFGSVGLGWRLDYDVVLLPFTGPQKRIVMPNGAFHNFVDDGSGAYRNTTSDLFNGAVMRAYPAGGPDDWEVVFKSERIWRFKPFAGITGVIRGGPPLFMVEIVEPTGATLSITRRSDGRLLAAGTQHRAVTATYGSNGFINEIKDAENRSTRFTYTAGNRIATVTDAVGGVKRFTYVDDTEILPAAVCGAQKEMGERIKTITYPGRPNPTENFYGVGRRVLRQVGFDGVETKFAYKLSGACVVNVANPGTRCTGVGCPDEDSWDNHQAGWRIHGGTVIGTTVTRADGSTDTVRHGAAGLMLERKDGNAQGTTYTRDAQGRITAQTDALGRTTRSTLDDKGNVTRRIDALGRITDTAYDSRWGKPTSITRYDSDGTPVTTLMAYSPTTGNLTRSTNPLGQSTTFEYTAQGQLAAVTDALGNRSELVYNAAGDLTVSIDPLGNDSRQAYDQVGRSIQSTDPLGYSASTQYNGLDQPTRSTDALGGVTRYAYDAANRLTSVTNALDKATESYGYDAAGRQVTRTDALGRSENLTYDALGRVATRTDRKGQVSRYSYDAEGRTTRIQRPDGTLSMAYDAAGRMVRIEDSAGGGSVVSYDYDAGDRLVRETQTTAAGTHVLAYEYDTLDRRT
ncbi:MAG: Ig-like domain-containing protein, partial [Mycobacteriaceae bacterium]|nr:Ig-like domain-containing protein [Mycobacteriaceae bacterium]